MKATIYFYILVFLMPLLGFSQTRYLDDMFSSIVVNSDVQYGTNISTLPLLQGLPPAPTALLCDIYEPANDSMTDRPVIILLHTGSFLPAVLNGQATGSKSDLSIVENCTRWAKKGYVAVAMNYRQGWNPTSSSQQVRTSTLLQASYRAQQDAKAMVRYMRKTVAEDGNNYGIDDSRIIIGGQGTGASIVLAYITLDTTAELYLPKFMDLTTTPPTPFVYPPFMGNIDGTDSTYLPDFASPTGTTILSNIPNNPSYSNDVNMAFNLGGTLVDLSWLDNSGIPLVSFHCENDPFADIDSGVIIVPATGDIVVTDVVGSRTVAHYNTLWGNNAGFNQAGFTDTLTQLANTYNNTWDAQYGLVYDGLYVFDTPDPSTTPNPFGEMPYHESSPWDWWDNTTYDMMFQVLNGAPAGYGAANSLLGSPNMSQAHANLYLDTIHGYLNPRIYEVLFHSDTIGCTDSLAQNYDQNAIFDDGSCLYCDLSSLISSSAPSSNSSCDGFAFTTPTSSFPIVSYSWVSSSGILVSTSNFVTNLCSDGYIVTVVDSLGCTSIDTLILGNVYGCTDPLSFSYSWPANIDDGSCTYCVATTISSVAPTSSTSCNGFAVATSTSSFPIVSYLWANSQGSIIDTSNYVTNLCAGTYIITVFDSVGCSTVDTLFLGDVYGCTDPSAFNYSWYSNIDDGSCIPIISGCIDVSAINYDSLANTNDGSCCLINQTIQIGQDIDGENAGDYSGQSVSLSSDGNTLAVGAHRNDGNGSNAGHVRLYTKISDPNFGTWTWSQIGQDIDGEAYYDESGQSVSLSSDGNTVAIGATGNDGNGYGSGHVRVYSVYSDCAGCIDPLALNYDSTLVYDDGSCIYPSGCTDPIAYNYDTIAITDDGSCLYCDLTNNFFVNSNTPGNCDGFILATSSSSNTPISYLWNNGSTQNNIISLCAGIYSLTITDDVGCVIEDTVFMNVITGCTDPLASNYDPLATYDDGSCTYSSNCTSPKPDGLYAYDVIDTRAKIGWNNMNSSDCMVWKYFVRYREVGTNGWTTKSAGVGNGLCNFGLNTVDKQLLNLTPSTTYEFKMKAFYCGGTSSNYSPAVQFTTSDVCPDMTNLSVQTFNSNQSKAKFTWDTTGTYVFARILLRVDTAGASWLTAGGFGVYYPTLFVNKFGLQSGESYRAQGRTFCDQNITAYRSPSWSSPIFWTQPGSIRLQGGTLISDLDVYPNPSRDVFNISFNSDEIQDLSIRILNLVGAEIYREEKQEFIGEYTKQINLDNYGKGIYFLEIATNNGVVNKKLILQ